MKTWSLAIRVRSVERNVTVLLFITRYKVVARLKSVDEILNCDHSLIAVVQEVPVAPQCLLDFVVQANSKI